MSLPLVWLITGSSSGLGLATTLAALSKGDIVVATLRKPETLIMSPLFKRYTRDQLHVLELDVTNWAHIGACFKYVKRHLGRLDVVLNNAGITFIGEVESIPESDARDLFEVNFWGAFRVTQEAVRFFREVNEPGVGGRLLQSSSIAGVTSAAYGSIYNASKHALEALSESLSKEVLPEWNIKVTLVEFGLFDTPVLSKMRRFGPHAAYKNMYGQSAVSDASTGMQELGCPEKAALAVWCLSRLPDPPLRLPLGKDALRAISQKGLDLVQVTEEFASWSKDLQEEAQKQSRL